MAVGERDPHTGHMTTGHEWNGIKELNTPVPKIVTFFLVVTALFSVVYWVLMPAWPVGVTYTKGLLGVDQRSSVTQALETAAMDRAVWSEKIATLDLEAIKADDGLMTVVRQTGPTLFDDNCAICHGSDAGGQAGKGFPSLTDAAWLWGGSPEAVAETIRVGINAQHDETRVSGMLAFGRDQMLDRESILKVVAYVRSLSQPEVAKSAGTETAAAGEEIFAENCSACHGEDAKGSIDMGAPNLTDGFWIYGGDEDSVFATVWGGQTGHMPAWEARLSPVQRKILALYVLDLNERNR